MITQFPFGYYAADMTDEYFLALGRMQHAFTVLEVRLTSSVSSLVAARPLESWDTRTLLALSAVLGGMRMADVIATLKRLFRVLNVRLEIRQHMDTLFSQISEIQFFRNRLTHYETEPWNDGSGLQFVNSDVDSSRELDKARSLQFKLDAIDAATLDLLALIGATSEVVQTLVGPDDFRPFGLPTWQYKPSMLAQQDQRSFQNPLPLLPPHEASHE